MAPLLVFLGIGFACTTSIVFACASSQKEKDTKQRLPRKRDSPVHHADDLTEVIHDASKPDKSKQQDEKETEKIKTEFSTLDEFLAFHNNYKTKSPSPSSSSSFDSYEATVGTIDSLEATRLPSTASRAKAVATPPTVNLPSTTKALVISYPASNYAGLRTIHTNSNFGPSKPIIGVTTPNQQYIHQGSSSTSKSPTIQHNKVSFPNENPVSQLLRPSNVSKNTDIGPITRLVPLRPDQRAAYRSPSASASTRPTNHRQACGHCSHCSRSSANRNPRQKELPREPESTRKTNRAEATPIVVMHPPRHNYFPQRNTYSRHFNSENETHQPWNETAPKKDDHYQETEQYCEDDEDDDLSEKDEDISENVGEDSDSNERARDDKDEDDEEEDYEAPTLDLRGLFVRESLVAVKVFLQEQDKKYIKSDFQESLRFVYIITGWGKLSAGKIPKLKPAVEGLLNTAPYTLDYKYIWTNSGEMEVDLIRRKEVAELRKRSEERIKQRKEANRSQFK